MLQGSYVALTTPFRRDLEIDFDAVDRLVERQIAGGTSGLVPCGTTGESPTLSKEEKKGVIARVIHKVKGRVPVIAGTGSYDTRETVYMTEWAKDAGANAALVLTPYYNKPTQSGMRRHFEAVADVGLPVVLYNVPGRTGVSLDIETAAALGEHPSIVAIKEASGDVDRVSALAVSSNLTILSGDDSLTLPMMAVGAKGVISVVANVVPDRMAALCKAALDGRMAEAKAQHQALFKLCRAMFYECNPQPVKTAQAMMGLLEEVFRLPLCSMSEANQLKLRAALVESGLL